MPAVAVPLAVAYDAVTVELLIPESETVNVAVTVPPFPSLTVPSPSDTSEMFSTGVGSSSVIVTVACESASVALTGELRLTTKVSFGSSTASPAIVTLIGCDSTPTGKVRVPLAGV